ncbi:MAG: hypothetical protein LBR81_03420 [Prevotellaceae bacterium]|jgi:uncharacterized protein (TIGR02145 family)|nr:hypothetical protein [Prevotellaceae bacterium]
MKAIKQILVTVVFVILLSSCNTTTKEKGVVINGVEWATRNVGEKGTFVDNPEDYGGHWGWEEAKVVCPEGWRLPTIAEMESLINSGSTWVMANGIGGRQFSSGGNMLFLPAGGLDVREENGGEGKLGLYWTSDSGICHLNGIASGIGLWFQDEDTIDIEDISAICPGYKTPCIRCVRDVAPVAKVETSQSNITEEEPKDDNSGFQFGNPNMGVKYILEVEYSKEIEIWHPREKEEEEIRTEIKVENYTANLIVELSSDTRTILNGSDNGAIPNISIEQATIDGLNNDGQWRGYTGGVLALQGTSKVKKLENWKRYGSNNKNIISAKILSVKEGYINRDEITSENYQFYY